MTREELRSIPRKAKRIRRDKEHLQYLRGKAVSVSSATSDSVKVQTSHVDHSNSYIIEAIDLAKEIERKEEELRRLQDEAAIFIGTLDDYLDIRIMTLRYIDCLTWETVGDLVGYTVRRLYQRESEILTKL